MRDLMALGAMLLIIPLAFNNAFIAYVLWCWAGLIGLDSYLYGFMAGLPYVMIFAVTTLVLILIKPDHKNAPFTLNSTTFLLILFGIHSLFVAIFAYDNIPTNWPSAINIFKMLTFCLVMPMLVTDRLRVHTLVVALVLALSYHGLLDGLKFVVSGGTHNARGVRFGDNNLFALVLITVIPLFMYLLKYSERKFLKPTFLGLTILTVLAVVATGSRGGFITLLVVGILLLWQSKHKVTGLLTLATFAAIVLSLASNSWFDRMSSVKEAGDDTSFMTRVAVWKKSSAIALNHPLLGGGFNAAQSAPTAEKYRYSQGLMGFIDTPDPYSYAAHSIYFQVMGDMGFLGFFLYIGILANGLLTANQIKTLATLRGSEAIWAADLAGMLKICLIAFMVGGALLSAAYYDIPFIVMMLLEATKQILVRKSLQSQLPGKL